MSPEGNIKSRGFRKHVQTEKTSFRKESDIRNWTEVRELVRKITPEFDEIYAKHDTVLQKWHGVRLQIADLPLNNNFISEAGKIRGEFINFYENPKNEKYDPDLLFRLEPVLKQITNLVSKRLK